jgi:hypothetical protein
MSQSGTRISLSGFLRRVSHPSLALRPFAQCIKSAGTRSQLARVEMSERNWTRILLLLVVATAGFTSVNLYSHAIDRSSPAIAGEAYEQR